MPSEIYKDNYRSRVKGLRDCTSGGLIKVFRAGPDGKPAEFLRIETPMGKTLLKNRRNRGG